MQTKMEPKYEAGKFEQEIYKKWEESESFEPDYAKRKSFCIIMPPPNANDPLHVGHAMFVTIEDILIRYHRMLGEKALWVPGTDHAGIETQYVFEKKLAKEGKSRFDYDRETLYQMIWDYVQKNSDVAIDQIKRLGASADWSRKKFTLDPDIVDFVLDTFIKLHRDGLIYRDLKLVNYCTRCGTAFSNLEVVHEERESKLYYVRYKLINEGSEGSGEGEGAEKYIVVATTRPETIFADAAIAVNPRDKRAKWAKGVKAINPLTGEEMPIIADEAVNPKFGTGFLKVTPAHDFTDEQIGKRHQLTGKQIIGFDGKLTELAGEFAGTRVKAAREVVVKKLQENSLIEKIDENYKHSVGLCYRCGTVIEPLPMKQWFIRVKPLVEPVLKALQSNKVKVYGAGHDKILKHWLTNLEDWNVSRQIVWGIRIPAWFRKNSSEYVISKESPGKDFVQETDTFDTWFSSSQWPVATLKTEKPGDFGTFYPTDVMETGYDILPFWVMRMLMMGIYLTGEVPFKNVYLHGLIRDEKGQKMSKSKGNVINPLVMIDKYGADALRMALTIRSTPGLDKGMGEGDIRAMRNLTNKIWNATRFIVMATRDKGGQRDKGDKKFLEHLEKVVNEVTKQLSEYRIGLATEIAYNEFWHWFCDEAIEDSKRGEIGQENLLQGLKTFLKLLHPFVPFVTEKCWEELKEKELLIKEEWPAKLPQSGI